jgi:DNA-directed RNA polymerase specialized sigma subunit
MIEYVDLLIGESNLRKDRIKFLRYNKKMTWTRIAKELGISRQRLYVIIGKGKKNLNEEI